MLASNLAAQQANTFQGSIPGLPASPAPLALGLEDAIQRGLLFNLGLLESQTAAQDNLVLADQTLTQSRDRFSSGVIDNVEVVQAQGAVATANDNRIGALYAHNLAKVPLARALGMAEQGIRKFIEVS